MKDYGIRCSKCDYTESKRPILYKGIRDFTAFQKIKKELSKIDCPKNCGKTLILYIIK